MILAAGLAVGIGAFVIWGPSSASRLRQRRGQIAGLHNFGKTCFLNGLLQSLASVPGKFSCSVIYLVKLTLNFLRIYRMASITQYVG